MNRKRVQSILLITALALLSSCFPITINVYFPEAKIQSAAAKIESQVRGETPVKKDKSWVVPNVRVAFGAAEAWAAEPDLNVDTPAIREIVTKRAGRFEKIDALLTKGFLGEGKDGLLKEKDKSTLSVQELAEARKLLKEENADRQDLYKEIMRENNMPSDQLSKVQGIFAKENRKRLKAGQYYEDDQGNWKKQESAG